MFTQKQINTLIKNNFQPTSNPNVFTNPTTNYSIEFDTTHFNYPCFLLYTPNNWIHQNNTLRGALNLYKADIEYYKQHPNAV